jgi:hypothetical protein
MRNDQLSKTTSHFGLCCVVQVVYDNVDVSTVCPVLRICRCCCVGELSVLSEPSSAWSCFYRWSLAVRVISPIHYARGTTDGCYGVDGIAVGAAYGTAKSGIGIAGLGGFKPELIMRVRSCHFQVSDSDLLIFSTVSRSSSHGGYCCSVWPRSSRVNIGERSVFTLYVGSSASRSERLLFLQSDQLTTH